MHRFIAQYEKFLLIDPQDAAGVLMRTRALYGFAFAFIAVQLLNLFGMTITYRAFTLDHVIALIAIGLMAGVISLLKHYRNFDAYAIFILVFSLGGVGFSAIPSEAGIHSSLVPFLILLPFLNGFISGPRLAIWTGGVCLLFVGALSFVASAAAGPATAALDAFSAQRTLQALFALLLATPIAALASANTFRLFELLEKNAARAKKAEAAKTDFLETLSGELTTPLYSVLGAAEELKCSSLDLAQEEAADTVKSASEALLLTMNDLLDISRLEGARLNLEPREFRIRHLIEKVAEARRAEAEAKGLSYYVHCCRLMPEKLIGDDVRIGQIVTSLISNAIKFTERGEVDISVAAFVGDDNQFEEQTMLQICVSDTAGGVPEDIQETLFDAFEKATSVEAQGVKGLGLGLTICRQLANLMGGSINFESTPGEGATFYLTVPVKIAAGAQASVAAGAPIIDTVRPQTDPPAELPEQEPTAAVAALADSADDDAREDMAPEDINGPSPVVPNQSTEPKMVPLELAHVLLVEDNIVNQMVASRFLEDIVADVDVAANGVECLRKIEERTFDAIIMDKHMPEMDGVEATAAIRKMAAPVAGIPIIACTADASVDSNGLIAQGFTAFLPKPLSLDSLTAILKQTLEVEPA